MRSLARRLGRRPAPTPEPGESFSHLLLEHVGDLVAVLAPDGTISYASPSHERVLGYAPGELLGTNVVTLVHPEDRDVVRRMRQSGEWRQTTVEFRLRHRDGSWRLIEGVARDLLDDPRVRGVLVTSRDVTARRSAETALRESQERYQTLARVSPVGIFHTDAAGAGTDVNDRWCEISGRTRAESLGSGLERAIHRDDRNRVRAVWRSAVARGDIFQAEYRLRRPDGAAVWVLGQAHPQWDEGGRLRGYVGTVTDISDRKRMEQALFDSENFLQAIFDTEPECVKLIDRDGTIRKMNRAGLGMLEATSPEQVIGRPMLAFVTETHRAVVSRFVGRLFEGEAGVLEFEIDGLAGTRRALETNAVPFRDAHGHIVAGLAVTRDITGRRRLERQLQQSQRLEALGRLAGGIAHDFNNLLTVIATRAELLVAAAPADTLVRDNGELILGTAHRAAALTRQLLAFSRAQTLDTKLLDLNTVVADMSPLIRRLIGEDVTVDVETARRPLVIRGDRTQLEQVVTNLVVNARDAMPSGGRLGLRTQLRPAGAFPAAAGGADEGYAVLTVSDTGTGMDEATRARIFDPFFTTKAPGEGTGLGLATVYGIVMQHQGHVDVASEPGRGSVFTVALPLVRAAAEQDDTASMDVASGGTETVLLVEDEHALRDVVSETLHDWGYTVIESSAENAARLPQDTLEAVDLLLTDVVMPEVSGPELALALQQRHPRLRVLYMSGYAGDALARRGIDEASARILEKPFTISALLHAVRDALAPAPARPTS